MSKTKYYAVLNDQSADVVTSFEAAKKIFEGKPGGHNRKFNTYAEAEVYLLEKIKERNGRLKFNKPKRGKRNPYQKKPTAMQLLGIAPDSLEVKSAKATKLVLTCCFGGKNAGSIITSSDGKSEVVKLSSGATAKLKYLELAYAAIKYADNAITGGVDCVEVWGIDGSVLVTLNEWAPKYRECGWGNSYGKPVANREVIEPMLELYEKLGDKVKLSTGEQPVDNDAPF
ncbi:viroplasmin family protein [Vibrio lentus]